MRKYGYPEDLANAHNLVLYETEEIEGVATITLNRPEKLNALSVPMRYRLCELVDQANADPKVKVLYFRGNGRALCAGDELNEDWGQRKSGHRFTTTTTGRYADGMVAGRTGFSQYISRSSKPTVARIHGYVFGAAFMFISTQIDFGVAVPDVRVGNPEARYFSGGGANPREMRILGFKAARRLAFTGHPITGIEAHELGLVYQVAPWETIDEEIRKLCADLVAQPMEQLLALKTRIRAAEASMNMLIPGLPPAMRLGHFMRRAKDEPDFWRNARDVGIGAALAIDRRRPGVLDPRTLERAGAGAAEQRTSVA